MPEYQSPGVYVEEVDSGARPIEGVGTAMAAFVGFAPGGPVGQPQLVTSWSQYVEAFGVRDAGGVAHPHMDGAYLSHAVYGYFNNGGGRCYVVRVEAGGTDGAGGEPTALALALPRRGGGQAPSLVLRPKGTPARDITVTIEPYEPPGKPPGEPSGDDPEEAADAGTLFTLRVQMGDAKPETYEGLGLTGGAPDIREVLARKSALVEVAELPGGGDPAQRVPKPGTYTLEAPSAAIGADGALAPASFIGDVAARTGFEGLEVAEEVTMVCAPDLMAAYERGMIDLDGVKAVQLAMIAHCERMADRVAILDAPPGLAPQDVHRWRQREAGYDSDYAALYYPWIEVTVPGGDGPVAMPPCGHVAGIFSRSDATRGVHKAPANEVVRGAMRVTTQVTKGEQDVLNPVGINCVRSFPGRGIRVWGARTLSSDAAWRYVNVRRLFNFVEESIERGTQWCVFEPNDPDLWARVRRDVRAFLMGVWRDGALFGTTEGEAFYVKCDEELNPPDVRDRGELIVEVGLAPVKPAEFVVFRFSQSAGAAA